MSSGTVYGRTNAHLKTIGEQMDELLKPYLMTEEELQAWREGKLDV